MASVTLRYTPGTRKAALRRSRRCATVGVVFNLAGEPVSAGRWTDEKKRRIRDSRVAATRNLVGALAELESRPKVLVSASAVGYYGDRGDEELDEQSPPGHWFLAEVCVD